MSDTTSADFAIAVYNDCRSEIRDRLGYRDQWISRYVFGVLAFLGASIGIEGLTPEIRFYLCLVMPVMSFVVAYNVKAHVDSVEKIADFLRKDFDKYLVEQKLSVPTWDKYTAQMRAAQCVNEASRNKARLFVHLVSLHGPSILSLGTAAATLAAYFRPAPASLSSALPLLALALGSIAVFAAIRVTLHSFSPRIKAGQPRPNRVSPEEPTEG
jgi:hypothetical protein